MNIIRVLVILVVVAGGKECFAQYFQFSQYNFTRMRVNPAQVGNSDYASVSFDYRNQSTDGGFHLTSNFLNAEYPLIARGGRRWGGLGVSMMDDRSGQAGIFNTQEAALSYSVTIPVARNQELALGMKTLYQTSKINLDGFYTGSQYVPDRGFDESMPNGENFGNLNRNFFTFSAGMYWHQNDRFGNRIAYWGLSFFDFNKPQDSFFGEESYLSSTIVAHGGARIYESGPLSVTPEVLVTHNAALNIVNVGTVTSYSLNQTKNKPAERVDVITKYVWGRSGIVGVQLHRETFSIGLSYDFPALQRNVANVGAFEIGLELRSPVDPRVRRSALVARKQRNRAKSIAKERTGQQNQTLLAPTDSVKQLTSPDNVAKKEPVAETMSERLKHKQDSIALLATAGELTHEPLVLEKATLRFNFAFNSAELDDQSMDYLGQLADALLTNDKLDIQLIGHTDNIGSDKFNYRLSLHRAEMIRDYLLQQGVSTSRVFVEGRGESEPFNENLTEEGRALNRRVELTIVYNQ